MPVQVNQQQLYQQQLHWEHSFIDSCQCCVYIRRQIKSLSLQMARQTRLSHSIYLTIEQFVGSFRILALQTLQYLNKQKVLRNHG
jgi:hypothetical protein